MQGHSASPPNLIRTIDYTFSRKSPADCRKSLRPMPLLMQSLTVAPPHSEVASTSTLSSYFPLRLEALWTLQSNLRPLLQIHCCGRGAHAGVLLAVQKHQSTEQRWQPASEELAGAGSLSTEQPHDPGSQLLAVQKSRSSKTR